MDVDIDLGNDDDEEMEEQDAGILPMPESGGIETLRDKLHARMAALRRGGNKNGTEAGDRDELLEERRRQRAAMREKRRKETKEKIRREEEMKGKKSKEKEKDKKDSRDKGNLTKVILVLHIYQQKISVNSNQYFALCRRN